MDSSLEAKLNEDNNGAYWPKVSPKKQAVSARCVAGLGSHSSVLVVLLELGTTCTSSTS